MKKITLLFFMSLLSWCGYSQLALETFESNGLLLPDGWTRNNVAGVGQEWNVVNHNTIQSPAYGGSGKVAFINRENVQTGTAEDWLITKQFTVPTNGQLRFQSRLTIAGNDGSTYRLMIHTGNTPNDPASYIPIVPTMGELDINPDPFQTEYLEKVFNLPASTFGQQAYIAFVMNGDFMDRWLVDNVMVVAQCVDPTTLAVTSTGLNQAVLNWANPGNANAWEIDIVGALQPPTQAGIAYSGLPPYTATTDSAGNPLQPDTDYKYYVRANCGGGNTSNWVGPFYFSTVALGESCTAPITITTPSYSTTDNTGNYGDVVDGSPGGATGCSTANGYLNGNDVFYAYTASATGNISINVTNNGAYSGVFVYNSCTNVGVTCAAGATTGSAPAPLSIPLFAVTAGQTYYVVISTWATPQTTPYTLTIQQVNCAPPVGLPTTGTGLTSAQLSWTNPSNATSWQVVVQDPGDGMPVGAGATVNTNTNYLATAEFDGTPLVSSTPYEYYVRADCGNGTFSAWAGPYFFNTTLCEADDQCNYTFVMTDSFGDGWNGNTMTVSQNGIPVATIGSTFTAGAGPISVTVPVCHDLPLTLFWNSGGNFPGEVGVSVQNGFGQTIFTKPSGTGSQNSSLFTGLVDCDTPACLPPTGLAVSNISTTSVTLNWSGPNTGNWDYYVVPAGSPAPTSSTTGVNTTSKPVDVTTGLTAATNYVYYVRIVCSEETNSTWAGPFPFTTAVCPLADQCVYSFIMTDSFGDGWNGNTMTITQNGATVATIGSTFTTGAGPVTVNIAMCHDEPFQLFWNSGGSFPGEVGVSIVNGFSQTLFTKPSGSGSQNTLLYSGEIDCINPACIAPTGLDAYDFTTDSAMLEWDGPATGTWEVFIVPAGDPAPANTTSGLAVTTNPVEVALPTPGINYDYYVRAMCGATESSNWAGPHEFHSMLCEEEDQCNYVFELFDSFGDGWNGNTMTIFQNDVPVATIGSTFTTGAGPVLVEVPLCPGEEFELFWNSGGSFPGEVGVRVYTPFEEDLYTKMPGTGAQNTSLYVNEEADCTPPPCPKPQDLFVDALGLTSADLNWTEVGTATNWEVYVVPLNTAAPQPTDSGTATTTMPHIATETVTGEEFTSGTTYVFYVRAICGEEDGNSNWSGPIIFTTLIENDDCDGAIDVEVNPGVDCDVFANGTITGATASGQAQTCITWTDIEYDVWYSFEATAETHAVNINNMLGATFQSVIYEGDGCGNLTQMACGNNSQVITGLTVGETYYVMVYTTYFPNPTNITSFEVCINTPPPPISVTQDEYTVEELVEEVLIGSDCAQISNIQSGTGTDYGMANGIGYFNQNGSEFPMAAGIVLVTGDAMAAQGPNQFPAGTGTFPGWDGDTDLEDIVDLAPGNSNDASWISFDFVAMTDELNFNFLFASEEYNMGNFECTFSDSFAFILTDNENPSNPPINLAVLPNTTIPIQVTNIHPDNGSCPAINEAYFGQYNNTPFDAINYNGQTIVLTATGPVEVNHSYNIKLVIANASDHSYNSAVFLEAGSFNIGEPELGDPSLESEGNAVCAGGERLLETGLSEDDFEFVWYFNEWEIPGAEGSTYLVTEEGEYKVEATFIGTDCTTEGTILVEFYDPIVDITNNPETLGVCDADGFATFDLTENTATILDGVEGTYNLFYYLTQEEAEEGDHSLAIATPTTFENTVQDQQTIWVRIEFVLSTTAVCSGVKSFDIVVEDNTPEFTVTEDFSICEGTEGTITVVPTNYDDEDVTYVWTHNSGPHSGTTNTITVTEAGDYEVTIDNNGCTATATVTVTTTPVPVADDPADVTICDTYVLPVLTTGNYYTATNGGGTMLNAGESITSTQDIYVYAASSTTPVCADENVFTVTIVPSPDVTTPGNISACVSYTLPTLTAGNYFTAAGGTGTQLNEGDEITTNQTIYVYAESGTTPNCIAEESFTVSITDSVEADAPADVTSCDSYVLPALSANNNYFTEADGAGTQLNAGDLITSTQEIHVYVATPTTPSCTDDNVFTVTIVPSPVAVTPGDQMACNSYELPVLAAGNYYTAAGGAGTMLNAGESVSATQTIFVRVESGTTPNCIGEASFTVTITPSPVADAPANVTACDSYVLPALSANNNYYTGANGTGTMLSAGETITGTQEIHVFATTGTTPDCTDDNVFTVTIVPSPVIATPGNVSACDGYVLPNLTVGNYFTGAAGTGTMLNPGESVTASQTIFIYAESGTTPNCTAEGSFEVSITTSPVADAPGDVASCDSYVLPSLGVGNYYTGPGGTGTQLAVGSSVTSSQTIYVYAQSGTTTNCTDENSFTVTIVPTPAIAITEGCNDDNVYVLEAIFTDEIYTPDNVTFEWTDAAGASLGSGASIVITQGGTYNVVVTPVGDADCPVPGQITVIDTTCDVQRGISPNGDDKNQSFNLTALDVRKLSIFNRYGSEVYSFSGAYTDQWEGQGSGGEELPTGTYFYMIERANGESRTGWVYINRTN
ncbi:choice-of-anchor L domain-containing protein [uncultured Flavobacterium sp.]|uniref:choice-of-anchor L domain-containing protein n=1 Tax=uncultured Flavobacterium sp. TaxID=165435 RepID=UPI0025F2845E|nr:choice-of-anchor L domain-containing protein [uncultured Flavobacterium sp.]